MTKSNEYDYNLLSDSIYYPKQLLFAKGLNFSSDNDSNTGFGSLYSITQESAEAIQREGTIAGFNGCVWSERLWIDVDSYEEAEKVELTLKGMKLDFIAFDSGGKGAHFGVLRNHPPSHLLPKKDRVWVRKHFPKADSSIYSSLHLFRLPGTVHQKTGRRKRLVVQEPGTALTLPKYEPFILKSPVFISANESVFKDYRVLQNIKNARTGDRHYTLVKIAYALKDKNVDETYSRWFLGEVNKLFEEPKTEIEVEKIVGSILSKP